MIEATVPDESTLFHSIQWDWYKADLLLGWRFKGAGYRFLCFREDADLAAQTIDRRWKGSIDRRYINAHLLPLIEAGYLELREWKTADGSPDGGMLVATEAGYRIIPRLVLLSFDLPADGSPINVGTSHERKASG